jgi:hypothetical protein
MSKRLIVVAGLFLLMSCLFVFKANSRELDIPSALKPWKNWVLYGEEQKSCPTYYNNGQQYCCVWPSRLSLSLHARGGSFEQQWLVLAEGWVPLPGNNDTWPMDVTANNQKVPVLERSGSPCISLKPGEYTVKGSYSWSDMPEMVLVPPASGLVSLMVDGNLVQSPQQEKDGRLWLKRSQETQDAEDRMDVRVYRLVTDSIPMEITTLLKVNVSGKAREVQLENALPEGFLAMEITSPIPARIASKTSLTVQARPGQWEIYVKGRSQAQVSSLGPFKTDYGQEIWAFQPKNDLRMVQIEGVTAVDPQQTDSPQEWRQYSAFVINNDSKIVFKESSRGDSNPSPDRLTLSRTWWLDFNGGGFTLQDWVSGTMSRQWRLAMNAPVDLGRVAMNGADQLITTVGTDKKPGVELRRGQIDLTAESRIESSGGPHSAVGWDHSFQSVSGVLNLPPGWKLITASGVDMIQGSWFQKWTLLDLFLVLVMSLAVFKLWGRLPGILTLITLVLIYHEPGAPKIVWINLIASLALLRFIPHGWIRRIVNVWRIASVIVLLVLSIPFMVQQVRWGVYPQLESPYEIYGGNIMGARKTATDAAMQAPVEVVAPQAADQAMEEPQAEFTQEKITVTAEKRSWSKPYQSLSSDYYANQAIQVIDKEALNQTGPGVPTWTWRSFSMTWNGPVEKDQNVRFWLISPFMNLVLSFVRVILLILLITVLVAPQQWRLDRVRLTAVALVSLILLIAPCGSFAQSSDNGFPPDKMLEELKKRLLEAPDCLPNCADIPKMEIKATRNALQILLQVNAARDVVIPLPGSMDSWLPDQVLLDSKPVRGIMKNGDGTLQVLVHKGTQTVALTGPIGTTDELQIPLSMTPRKVAFSGDGWEIQGIDKEGRAESGIKLIRRQKESGKKTGAVEQATLPAFFEVERIISLGLDWQVRTRVTRMTPAGTAELLSIPLIAGESVITAGVRVENGMAHVQMAPDESEVLWVSTLKKASSLTLKAPAFVSWTEVWDLETSTIWHCDYKGIPVIKKLDDEGAYRPQWRPWPGEEVTIDVSRPAAVQGQVVTIDSARLSCTPGERFSKAVLFMNIRTSKGGQHKVALPAEAQVQKVAIQGVEQSINAQGREVMLPLQPGAQGIEIEWNQPSGASMAVKSPEITIGEKAVNADVTINMPSNRWVLWTTGPRLGPAVLFWSYLFVVILAALALGRIPWTPLTTRHWLLLGLGLTQVHPLLAIMIVGWFLALGQRRSSAYLPKDRFGFDAMQVLLVAWTVAAMVGLYFAIQKGLLGIPDMQISGNGSTNYYLHWTQDRVGSTMPRPAVISLHLMLFRFLMLAWALWLALSLIKWLKWGWEAFHEGGVWRKIQRRGIKAREETKIQSETETRDSSLVTPPDLPMP